MEQPAYHVETIWSITPQLKNVNASTQHGFRAAKGATLKVTTQHLA